MLSRVEHYTDDPEFAVWLRQVDEIVQSRLALSLFDLEDMLLRDSYDAGDTPEVCVQEVVKETVRENYGADASALLD
jgi:hypothetical protein